MTFQGDDEVIPTMAQAMLAERAADEEAERARVGRVLDTAYMAAEAEEKR